MKLLYVFLLLPFVVFAQDYSNRVLGIPKTLHQKEIRVYSSNYSYSLNDFNEQVFRLYENEEGRWFAEFYMYKNGPDENSPEIITERKELKNSEDFELTWLKIQRTHVLHLPSQKAVLYKFVDEGEIVKNKDGSYSSNGSVVVVADGGGLRIVMRSGDKENNIVYNNPEYYLKLYPNVDELISIHELLEIIRNNFGVWKD